jgi:hypothetical protein
VSSRDEVQGHPELWVRKGRSPRIKLIAQRPCEGKQKGSENLALDFSSYPHMKNLTGVHVFLHFR